MNETSQTQLLNSGAFCGATYFSKHVKVCLSFGKLKSFICHWLTANKIFSPHWLKNYKIFSSFWLKKISKYFINSVHNIIRQQHGMPPSQASVKMKADAHYKHFVFNSVTANKFTKLLDRF